MKTLLNTLILTSAFCISQSCASQSTKTVQTAIIKTSIVCDHCKVCETCGGLLEKTLIKQKGIQMITLDEKNSTITVIYNSKKIALPAIKSAISNLGYDADEVKADPVGYEKLDGCCKV